MTATKDIATLVEAWVAATLSINTYPDNPEEVGEALPLVVGDITNKRLVKSDTALSQWSYEQPLLKLWNVRVVIMVAPDPVDPQTQTLYDFADSLEVALRKDQTLGGRVQSAAPTHDTEFPGELTHPSGVVARGAILSLVVGELTPEK